MSTWTLRYRAEDLDWHHSGADLAVGADGSVEVVWAGGPGAERAAERATSRAARLRDVVAPEPGERVVAFELRKQAPGAELLAGVTLRLLPADEPTFSSRLTEDGAVPAWERWWNGLVEAAVLDEARAGGHRAAIELVDALAHPVDSKDLAWKIVSTWAVRYGLGDVSLRGADTP